MEVVLINSVYNGCSTAVKSDKKHASLIQFLFSRNVRER